MGKRTRRNHAPALEAEVALAALKGEKTLAELVQQFDVHPNQITTWKGQLVDDTAEVFGSVPISIGCRNLWQLEHDRAPPDEAPDPEQAIGATSDAASPHQTWISSDRSASRPDAQDLVSPDRVKMLVVIESWSGCRGPRRAATA